MILVTDSNIIYSALINPNGVIAKIFNLKKTLFFCEQKLGALGRLKKEVKKR